MNKTVISLILIFLLTLTSVLAITNEKDVEKAFEEHDNVRVIIMLKDGSTRTVQTASVEDLESKKEKIKQTQEIVLDKIKTKKQKSILNETQIKSTKTQTNEEIVFELKYQYKTVNSLSGKINKKAFEELKLIPEVEKIYLDGVFHKTLHESAPLMNVTPTWPLRLNNRNITGTNQAICIIDTGIDTDHPDFAGRIIAQKCYCTGCCQGSDESSNAEDDEDHGTHVAGIAAGNGSTYKGVAPNADIVAVKVLNDSGTGLFSDTAQAIDWCVANKNTYNISVITMSLGDRGQYNNPTTQCDGYTTTNAIASAVSAGIIVTVASGNEGYTNGLNYPACGSSATSVGSTTKSEGVSSFSNGDEILDLLATGGTSAGSAACPTSNYICSSKRGGGYIGFSGTSMATPQVAGAAALLQQFKQLQDGTSLTPIQIKTTLNSTGKQILDSGVGMYFSRIDVFAAINSLDSVAPTITLNSPENNSALTNLTQNFIYMTTENGYCNLYLNESGALTINQTQYTIQGTANFTVNLTEQHWLWDVECNDSAGNIANSSNNQNLIIDTTYPTISFDSLTQSNNSNLTRPYIEINVTYTEVNFKNITLNLNGTTYTNTTQIYQWNETGLSDGNYTYNITICDLANNCNYTESRTLFLDANAPEFSPALENQTLEYMVQFSYDINATNGVDNFSINDTTNFIINGSGYLTNNTLLQIGIYSLNITVNDTLGNQNSGIITITMQDTTYPTFDFTPENQELNYSQPFTYDINATDLLLANYSINNSNFAIEQNGTITNNTQLPVGTHSIQITINDTSGNTNISTINIVVKLNQTQEILNNTQTNISLSEADANLTLYINQSFNTTIVVSKETPTANGTYASKTSIKGINIDLDNNTNASLEWAIITLYFNSTDISGLVSSSLKIYFYNESSNDWVEYITTLTSNSASANVTHFSLYGLFGDPTPSPTTTSGGGGGGGGSSSSSETPITLSTIGTQYTDLKRNDIFKFTENNIVYSLKLTQVSTDNVDFLFTPTNEKFTLTTNQDKTIDLTSDKKLSINLNNIVSRKATITLKKVIAKVLPVITFPAKKTETSEIEEIPVLNETIEEVLIEDTKKPFNILKWSIITITLIILITGFSYVTYEKYKNLKRIREML